MAGGKIDPGNVAQEMLKHIEIYRNIQKSMEIYRTCSQKPWNFDEMLGGWPWILVC